MYSVLLNHRGPNIKLSPPNRAIALQLPNITTYPWPLHQLSYWLMSDPLSFMGLTPARGVRRNNGQDRTDAICHLAVTSKRSLHGRGDVWPFIRSLALVVRCSLDLYGHTAPHRRKHAPDNSIIRAWEVAWCLDKGPSRRNESYAVYMEDARYVMLVRSKYSVNKSLRPACSGAAETCKHQTNSNYECVLEPLSMIRTKAMVVQIYRNETKI